ncbi:MAG: HD domain-containing protein [Gammaproteobacteria bacterium]|nr:MAG: HD domain-containing protein [Gammaproteobacteria bacterium]
MTDKIDLQLLMEALTFAAHKHRDQRRKDPDASPYINHPLCLANVLVNEGGITDTEILCGAILHDTVEDTETKQEELTKFFGHAISDIVMECTDDHSLEKHERKQAQIDHAPHLSKKAKAVKLADKICNLRDVSEYPPPNWPLERRQGYFEWARRVIDGLRGEWPELEKVFDEAYETKPES